MAITGNKEINFIVYKNETFDIETIKFEEETEHAEIFPLLQSCNLSFLAPSFLDSRIIGKHPILNKKVIFIKKKGLIKFHYTLYKERFTTKHFFYFSREWPRCERWSLFTYKGVNIMTHLS